MLNLFVEPKMFLLLLTVTILAQTSIQIDLVYSAVRCPIFNRCCKRFVIFACCLELSSIVSQAR